MDMMTEDDILFIDPVKVTVPSFCTDGYVLDIGGGGEGVIGRLNSLQVIAIDCVKDELEEAPKGPLKIVMDARGSAIPRQHIRHSHCVFLLHVF